MKVKTRFSGDYKKAFPNNRRKSVEGYYHYVDWITYDIDPERIAAFKNESREISVYDEESKSYAPKQIPVLEVIVIKKEEVSKKSIKSQQKVNRTSVELQNKKDSE